MKGSFANWRTGLFVAALCAVFVPSLQGKTYYISPNGSDANSGTISAPWATFRQAFSVAGPGDTVFVRGGEYPSEMVTDNAIAHGGAQGNYLVIKAFPGETPILNDFGRFQLTKPYIRVEGLTFLGAGISAQATGCQVVGNTFSGPGFGIGAMHAFGNDLLFEGNTIDVIQNTTLDHGLYVHEGDGITIRKNRFLRSFGYAIHIFGQNQQSTPKPLKNIVIEDNYISGSEQRSGILTAFAAGQAFDLSDIIIRNNIITGNGASGISLRQGKNIKVYNNTIYENQQSLTGSSIGPSIIVPSFSGSEDVSNVTISNNLIVTTSGQVHVMVSSSGPNIVVDNNLYWPQGNGIEGTSDSRALFADPMLVNPAALDFHLDANSPAVDAGLTLAMVTEDFDGTPRPQGAAYDIGAFEFTLGPTSVEDGEVSAPRSFELLQNYPNPFNPSTQITFVVPQEGRVKLTIYNVLGQQIRTLFDQNVSVPGVQRVVWDGRDGSGQVVPSGLYFYRLESKNTALSRRMILLK
ncbi:T9SS C-terminal target domain-containing protein [Candidatus Parcubacteria bacterium]|nr:MAG: T9SS C-terminal target domain-containing protein [Candidatus Parcubacteria bacterium]